MTAKEDPKTSHAKWFYHDRFGMFIHWGIYSVIKRGEKVMETERIPADEYARYADLFNPTRFDADAWAETARNTGMKYMVLTTRHHDGFCLFDSAVSDFTSVRTRARRDFVAEYAEAARRAGLKVGFYYSLLDWRWPEYFKGPKKDPQGWERFRAYVHAQVRELCTQYGKIDLLWYDGVWPYDARAWKSAELNQMVRDLQPGILINNRAGLDEDYDTPEKSIVPSPPGRLWECCMPMPDTWSDLPGDHNWKSTLQLLRNLLSCASRGGNLLLNVGPRGDGTFPERAVECLREIGEWMSANGESVYGTEPCLFCGIGSGRLVSYTTVKDNLVYLHVFYWPHDGVVCVTEFENKVKRAYFLRTGEAVNVVEKPDRILLDDLPPQPADPYDSVIVLELDGKPEERVFSRY